MGKQHTSVLKAVHSDNPHCRKEPKFWLLPAELGMESCGASKSYGTFGYIWGLVRKSMDPLAWTWTHLRKSWEGSGFRFFVDILDESLGAVGFDLRCIPGPRVRF